VKKRVYAVTIAFSLVLISFVIIAAQKPADPSRRCAKHLRDLGWQIVEQPIEIQEITVPVTFDEVYEGYNKIQKQGGFDLAEYAGKKLTRYTFEVKNFEGLKNIRANVLVYQGQVIGGDIMSVAIDGFMLPLVKH